MDIPKSAVLAFVVVVLALCGVFLPKDKSASANHPTASAYVTTADGKSIPISYSWEPSKLRYLTNRAAQFREVPPSSETIEVSSQALVPERKPAISRKVGGCLLEFGGLITVLKVHGGTLRVKYESPGDADGVMCPSGEFNLEASYFRTMNDKYLQRIASILVEKKRVEQLLKQNIYGRTKEAGEWRMVQVVNPTPILQSFSNGGHQYISYGDYCWVGSADVTQDGVIQRVIEGGTVQERSVPPEKGGPSEVLYEYHIRNAPKWLECPSETLFLNDPTMLVAKAQ